MGRTLPSWRRDPPIHRHGEPCCTHMRTQIIHKAPKWSIQGKRKDPSDKPTPGPQSPVNIDAVRYYKEPAYSFGNPPPKDRERGSEGKRPFSAPAGPRSLPAPGPTTPLYSFGTTRRELPFAVPPGPGPGAHHPSQRDSSGGPKYSIKGRPRSRTVQDGGPGPHSYRVRPPSPTGRAPPFPRALPPRSSSSLGPGPGGPSLNQTWDSGVKYSMGMRLPDKVDTSGRRLGPPFTHFGYDEFGHTRCVC
mmetsp:Transcript_29457/g.67858  ORF Transcript_29457/g.67858 Transcript_29457/m.67858 type:complete len:247 (+) Transcript_29457:80-820(+)